MLPHRVRLLDKVLQAQWSQVPGDPLLFVAPPWLLEGQSTRLSSTEYKNLFGTQSARSQQQQSVAFRSVRIPLFHGPRRTFCTHPGSASLVRANRAGTSDPLTSRVRTVNTVLLYSGNTTAESFPIAIRLAPLQIIWGREFAGRKKELAALPASKTTQGRSEGSWAHVFHCCAQARCCTQAAASSSDLYDGRLDAKNR